MDAAVVSWAWEQYARPTAKLVLVALASESNQAGECWPSLSQICDMSGLARSSVAEALSELERLGLISRKRGKGGAVTRYRLAIDGILVDRSGPKVVRDSDSDSAGAGLPSGGLIRESNHLSPGHGLSSTTDGLSLVREPDSGSPTGGLSGTGAGLPNPPLIPP